MDGGKKERGREPSKSQKLRSRAELPTRSHRRCNLRKMRKSLKNVRTYRPKKEHDAVEREEGTDDLEAVRVDYWENASEKCD